MSLIGFGGGKKGETWMDGMKAGEILGVGEMLKRVGGRWDRPGTAGQEMEERNAQQMK